MRIHFFGVARTATGDAGHILGSAQVVLDFRENDRTELKRYVSAVTGDIKKIAVVHGEETQALAFVETLHK